MQTEVAERLAESDQASRLQDVLQLFGYTNLKPEQSTVIEAIIAGEDVLAVLPTGYGKSACFQIPGVVTRSRTLVVSPLIALMENQVRQLRKLGIKAFCLHSDLTEARKLAVYYYFAHLPPGEPCFLYLSPEQLLTDVFHQRFDGVFDRLAVDEAHCVSTWGDAFRPDYQRIRVAVQRLRIRQCAAFTATVDPKIERDIRKKIPLRPGFVRVEMDPFRANLRLEVVSPALYDDPACVVGSKKLARLLRLLDRTEYIGPTIVYCSTREGSASLWSRMRKRYAWKTLNPHGYTTYLFHAGLPYEDKDLALEGFMNDDRPIIFATSAFGMGIDRPDVRQVIHYSAPTTLIDYAQQVGRAGRDGLSSLCTMFHLQDDILERRAVRQRWNVPTYDFVEGVHRRMRAVLSKFPQQQRRRYNIHTFTNIMRRLVEANDRIRSKDAYLTRVKAAIGMLQRVGVILEDGDGLAVFDIIPGSQTHLRLLEMTQMEERKLERESDRLVRFFDSPNPNQRLLWDILRTDEYPLAVTED